MEYVIKTPNEHYKGITEGVQFEKGVGSTPDRNTRNILVNDYGYTDITPEAKPKKAPAKKTSAK